MDNRSQTLMTSRFGAIEVDPGRLVTIDGGIPGFPELTQIVVIEAQGGDDFRWIQSATDNSLAFLAVVPWRHFPRYEVELSTEQQQLLDLDYREAAEVYCLVNTRPESHLIYVNLRAPLVINWKELRARQIILPGDHIPIRALLTI